tara:strand:+ start:120 stop:401 length:282 start_codon:yes stop_codon:yes gene_type:complete
MVPEEGFEPPTFGLQNRCTTTVLFRHIAFLGNLPEDTPDSKCFSIHFLPLSAIMDLKSANVADKITAGRFAHTLSGRALYLLIKVINHVISKG